MLQLNVGLYIHVVNLSRLKREFLKCLYGSLKDECNGTASAVYTKYNLISENRFLRGCEISEHVVCMNLSYRNCCHWLCRRYLYRPNVNLCAVAQRVICYKVQVL